MAKKAPIATAETVEKKKSVKKTTAKIKEENAVPENLPAEEETTEETSLETPVSKVKTAKKTTRKKAVTSAPKTPKVPGKSRKKIPDAPPTMKAFWGVYNQQMLQVAQYDYSERVEAQKAADDLSEKKKTPHYIQIIKKVV